ncbi:hypothetical protein [Rhodoferax sp. TS-BS-61-7]|uniref:hypothetical protein n=1 Tax=Rhodoferax sp. TS-BS-61-7 TaxID=2094194 RepID=UPI000CF62B59|nr:hypothetical protein [Rhodoferax sp. TS-BS-61-7]PQA78076.1 hypothetical protein C5F53_07000 [Rhodoferax sp. TS-BS-61-7]
MAYNKRRYRKRNSVTLSSTIGDLGAIANWFGPKGALITGVAGFILLYFVIPGLIQDWIDYNKAKMTGQLAAPMGKLLDDAVLRRFIRPSEWAGIATLILCSVISIWKAVTNSGLDSTEQKEASFWSRLLARFLD